MSSEDLKRLTEDNINLVHYCCHKLNVRPADYEDLFQTGCVGLVKAAKNFDTGRGVAFSTYAVPVIFGEIKRVFRDDSPVKMSRSLKTASMKVASRRQQLSLKLGREPTVGEIAADMDMTAEEVTEAVCAARCVVSLTVGDDDGENQFDIPVDSGEEEICNRVSLSKAISELEEKEKTLILKRYFEHKTQSEAASDLGMTQVQVSRMEKRIMLCIKQKLTG